MISGHEPGTTIRADGLVLYGGESNHFRPPPQFIFRSASKRDPDNGIGYPDNRTLQSLELPNEERYPIQLRDMQDPAISGFAVIGVQSNELPWRVVKEMWDGDALHVKGCNGHVRVSDVYWENVEDGFGPDVGPSEWTLERAWMKDIRDDAVENDQLIDGTISDCLIDGCFVFLSQRASASVQTKTKTIIHDCIVRVSSQAHDGDEGREWRDRNIKVGEDGIGRAPGMIFKWDDGAGTVEVKNCVFMMDAISVNGVNDMLFPPGVYENVSLIWLGPGGYPGKIPKGVSVTTDPDLWERSKQDWIERQSENHPGFSATARSHKQP